MLPAVSPRDTLLLLERRGPQLMALPAIRSTRLSVQQATTKPAAIFQVAGMWVRSFETSPGIRLWIKPNG
jgi:hypothetical protein